MGYVINLTEFKKRLRERADELAEQSLLLYEQDHVDDAMLCEDRARESYKMIERINNIVIKA